MRSIEEIDRDHEGMNTACVRRDHGCTYPGCACDRAKREVPNVRGVTDAPRTSGVPRLAGSIATYGVRPVDGLADWLRRMADHFIAEGGFQGGVEVADMLRWADALGVQNTRGGEQ